jgi:hypothetical protein
MKVDVTAMWQGISDARDKDGIPQELYNDLWKAVSSVSYQGSVGRRVCDYGALLQALALVQTPHWFYLTKVWRRLGESLASGISVASNE